MIPQGTNVTDGRTRERERRERMSLQFLFRRMEDGRRTDGCRRMRSYAVRYARNHGADDDDDDGEGEMKAAAAAAAMMHSDVYGLLLFGGALQGIARSPSWDLRS